ncbi:MAG: flippase-like domain-containing protein [Chloroflexia bacterium]|nr:flippase-like domain-containing protein [Chloroflexia bacterium]
MTSDSTAASGRHSQPNVVTRHPGQMAATDDARRHDYEDPEEEEAAELDDPGDPESLGSRMLRPRTLVSFAIAILIIYFVFQRLNINPRTVWGYLRNADPLLFGAAVTVFFSSFVLRTIRWKMMLSRVGFDQRHGYAIPGIPGMFQIFILSWFANCVVPARLGDAYRSFLLKERAKTSFTVGLGTILAERLIDLVVMVGMVLVTGVIVFGTSVPSQAERAFLVGAVVVAVGIAGAVALWFLRDQVVRLLPERFTHHFLHLHGAIFDILKRPYPYAGIGILIWLSDGLRLFLIARSLGTHLRFDEAIVVSLLSALVTIVPITPAGLGVVEGFMIWLLPRVGVLPDPAAAIAFLDRFATYWILILVGLPLYFINLRRDFAVQERTRQPQPQPQ